MKWCQSRVICDPGHQKVRFQAGICLEKESVVEKIRQPHKSKEKKRDKNTTR